MKIAVRRFQLGLKPIGKRHGIGSGAGKACQHFTLIQPPDFACRILHHGFIERHLPIARNRNLAVFANAHNRRRVHCYVQLLFSKSETVLIQC